MELMIISKYPTPDSLDISYEITLAAWVMLDAYDNDWPKIIIKPYDSLNDPWELYTLDLGHYGDTPRFIITDGIANGSGVTISHTSTLSLNQWHHIVGTYDGSTASLYINNSLVASQAASFQIGTNNMPLAIGGRLGTNSFDGFIEDIRIYDIALGANEVTQLYNLRSSSTPNQQPDTTNIPDTITKNENETIYNTDIDI